MDKHSRIPSLALWTGLLFLACLIGMAATPHGAGATGSSGSHAQFRMLVLSPTGPTHVDASVTDVPSCVSYLRNNTAGRVIQNYSDSDLQALCSGLLKPPADPNTFDSLASCVVDHITSSDLDSGNAIANDCRQKAGCGTRLPDALVEWLDGRVSAGCAAGASLKVTPNKSSFQVNDSISICYTVPGPGFVIVTDRQGGSSNQPLPSGMDDGTGACVNGTITPPTGQECVHLNYTSPSGFTSSDEKCWTVTNGSTTASQPPSGGTTTTSGSGTGSCGLTGTYSMLLGATGTAGSGSVLRATLNLTQSGTALTGTATPDPAQGIGTAAKPIKGSVSGSNVTLYLPWNYQNFGAPLSGSPDGDQFTGKINDVGSIVDANGVRWTATPNVRCVSGSSTSNSGSASTSSGSGGVAPAANVLLGSLNATQSGSSGSGGFTSSSSPSSSGSGNSGCADLLGVTICIGP